MRNNENKWLSILAAICITAMMFAGCGEKGVENDLTTNTPVDTAETTGTPTAVSGTPGDATTTGSAVTTAEPSMTTAETTQTTHSSGGSGGSSIISTISSAVGSVTNSGSNDQKIEYGTFQLLVSDRPADIEDFEHLNVTLSKARVFKAGGFRYGYGYGYGYGSEEGQTGFKIIDFENKTVDLTKLVGPKSLPISEIELPAGKYTKVELYVDDVEAELKAGGNADVMVPSGKLMITKNFNIIPGEETTFVFDINVIKKGHSNNYNLLPVISESGVVGEDLKPNDVEVVDN
ncbi:MAG: DUF4382 domain-containing protein [Archaeoglobaceae archaeon]